MKKKPYKGCLGNVVDSVLSDPIKKKRPTSDLPSDIDSVNHIVEQQKRKDGGKNKKSK